MHVVQEGPMVEVRGPVVEVSGSRGADGCSERHGGGGGG